MPAPLAPLLSVPGEKRAHDALRALGVGVRRVYLVEHDGETETVCYVDGTGRARTAVIEWDGLEAELRGCPADGWPV